MKDLIFLIDFDRTITINDSTDELMKLHNEKLMLEYQDKFRRKEIRVRDYIKDLLESLKLTKKVYDEDVSKNVIVDRYFKDFLKLNYDVKVVSAGTYENILPVFKKNNINIEEKDIYSNKIDFEGDKITVSFPYDNNDSFEGICKKSILLKYKKLYKIVVFIGDGYSDIPASKEADILFAKEGRSLEKYCIKNNMSYISYRDFSDIIKVVKENFR